MALVGEPDLLGHAGGRHPLGQEGFGRLHAQVVLIGMGRQGPMQARSSAASGRLSLSSPNRVTPESTSPTLAVS